MTTPIAEQHISSRKAFSAVLRDLKQRVADGTLRQIGLPDAPFAFDIVADVAEEGPWPDYIEAYFEDPDGRRYKLAVETYHGAGGSFEQV